MLLKKQTVWLLTMVSLVVVLSVYYITNPDQKGTQLTSIGNKDAKQSEATNTDKKTATSSNKSNTDTKANGAVISSVSSDDAFEAKRLEMADARTMKKEELETILTKAEYPESKRVEAYEQMKELDDLAQKEYTLETLIKAKGSYDDVLVRADEKKVLITVKAKEKSSAEANKIIKIVEKELGTLEGIAVEFKTPS